jgi:hypothetical protein
MSTIIAVTALRHRDLFATPNGSIYEMLRGSTVGGPVQARLWCAHAPDRLTCTPPRLDVPPAHPIRLLRWEDIDAHARHAGYVRYPIVHRIGAPMNHTRLWHDLTTAIQDAVRDHRDRLPEGALVHHSDALLAMLPRSAGAQPTTTAAFLRQHATPLHAALCRGQQPRILAATVAEQLHASTRAVLLAGVGTGMSIEAAVAVALVLYTRGVASFCALPAVAIRTA